MENGKPKMKYVAPPGRANLLYLPIGTDPASLTNPDLPLIFVEGEFKAIALDRLARYGRPPGELHFLAAGLSGVWNWRGTVAKTTDAVGNRIDVKGPIPDLAHIPFDDRRVLILFDADLEENESVRAARAMLTKELRSRAARCSWFTWPHNRPTHANGIDDLLAALGPEAVLPLIESAFEHAAGPPDLMPFHFADSGNAERLVALHGADMRFCFDFKKWLIWDGRRWAIDRTGRAVKLAKETMISFLQQAIEAKNEVAEKFARASLDARRLQAMLMLAQSELPVLASELDCAPDLMNFTNGTVNLRSGELSRHRRSDRITKMAAFPYRAGAICSRWRRFIDEIMGGGPDASEAAYKSADELTAFLQLSLGYSITGDVSEKVVFIAYGSGDNGKTTLLSVVRDLLREYSVTVGLDLLTSKDDSNNVAAARAKLLGARLVMSSETEEGQHLSAARLKRICQGPGGEIEACKKYENPITFPETHKLWIDANHKPGLPATDLAVWNRVRLIPFTVTIPKEEQDRELKKHLLDNEAEGILAWLVEGARRWYEQGLPQSQIVAEATAAWREELNRLRAYLDEYTQRDDSKDAWVLNRNLFGAYKSWCESNGERYLSQAKFNAQMESMRYRKDRKEQGNVWWGLRFKPP
jgi:putative DNA primase/helicase